MMGKKKISKQNSKRAVAVKNPLTKSLIGGQVDGFTIRKTKIRQANL
jgi:hypothetical protein